MKRKSIALIEKLRLKKWRRALNQREKARRRHTQEPRPQPARVVSRGALYRSRLMQTLRMRFKGRNVAEWHPGEAAWVIKIPQVLSFAHNYHDTLDVIYSIVEVSRVRERLHVRFDYLDCIEIGLGASALLDTVTMELAKEWGASGKQFAISGRFPKDQRVNNHLRCTGLTKHLNIKGAEASPEVEANYLKTELMVGRASTSRLLNRSSDQEKKASDLALHLDNCFRKGAGYKLNRQGLREIVRWAGELIANAEEHSGSEQWYAISYMTDANTSSPGVLVDEKIQPDPNKVYICQLTIFGFGDSIAESLGNERTPKKTREQIEKLAAQMSKRAFFGPSRGFSKFDLMTLYSLQEGVSRFNQSPGQDSASRGSGTIAMIDAFQTLGASQSVNLKPEMVLISGNTRIHFDQEYKLGFDANGRKILAFNKENDLTQRPDRKHVHSLNGFFPGTLYSFRFFIDRRHLEALVDPIKNKIETDDGH